MAAGTLDLLTSYPALFAGCALSGLAFPVPEDVLLLAAGIGIATGTFTWETALPVVLTGLLLRDTIAFLLGRLVGERALATRLAQRFLPVARIHGARALVARRGPTAVLLARLAVGFRVPVFLAAGLAGIRSLVFFAIDGAAMVLTVPLEVALGERLGPPALELASRWLRGTGFLWAGLATAAVVAFAWRRRAGASRAT